MKNASVHQPTRFSFGGCSLRPPAEACGPTSPSDWAARPQRRAEVKDELAAVQRRIAAAAEAGELDQACVPMLEALEAYRVVA